MADYYSQATIMPFIKDEFVTDEEKELLRKFGFDCIKSYLEKEISELVDHLKEEAKNYDASNTGSFDAVSKTLWEQSDTCTLAHISKRCGEIQALFGMARKFGIELSPDVQRLEIWGDVINPAS